VPAVDRYDSIAVSCHKFFGFPSPAGLFVTRQSVYNEFNAFFSRVHNPEYIHHVPGTITCSRDAVKPAEFYYFTTPSARARQVEDAQLMLSNAAYLFDELRRNFPQLSPRRANPLSNTIFFRNPGEATVREYSLATMELNVDGTPESFSHVVVMPHVSREILARFLTDLERRQAKKTAIRGSNPRSLGDHRQTQSHRLPTAVI
jgi:histidine decarboxylase